MPSLKTEHGRDWTVERLLNGDDEVELKYIAVGTGNTDPAEEDVELESEEYETTFDDSNANLYIVGDLPGTYRANITISGGVEVPADTEITEFGIKDENGDLVYREVRSGTTITSGERISFEIEIEVINT